MLLLLLSCICSNTLEFGLVHNADDLRYKRVRELVGTPPLSSLEMFGMEVLLGSLVVGMLVVPS